MLVPRKLLWILVSAASAAAAGVATRKLVDVGWRMTTGSDTPAEDDDSASFGQALAWAAGVGAAAGVARIVSRRTAATVWEKTTGDPPPGAESKA